MVINCVGGIGDILFCEPIYRNILFKTGEKPSVIIHDHLMFIENYIDSANFVPASSFPSLKDRSEPSDNYLPLRYANQIVRKLNVHDHSDLENMMADKYRLCGLDPELWKTINIKFQYGAASGLFSELHQWKRGQYLLVNEHSQIGDIEIKTEAGEARVSMRNYKQFTVIDWFLLMVFAKENHHVSTSTFYIMQAIKNKFPDWENPCYIYPRPNEDGLRGISQLKPDFNLILKP